MGDMSMQPGPVGYVNVAVGRDRTLACVQHGLYLLRDGNPPLAAVVDGPREPGGKPRFSQIQVEVMAPEPAAALLAEIRENMRRHNVYRG